MISVAIQRKLAEEMPETDEDMEEGGAGDSRVGTLLLLLRRARGTSVTYLHS